jgi:hypothetical protein
MTDPLSDVANLRFPPVPLDLSRAADYGRWKLRNMFARRMGALGVCGLVLLGTGSAVAQSTGPNAARSEQLERFREGSARFQARVEEAAHDLDREPQLADLTQQQRKDLVAFVTGNLLFALLHELAHAHIQEMRLPVLGREEDAADAYAVLVMLKVATRVSHRVLVDAAKGWFLSAEAREKAGMPLAFYQEHGIDQQRAYQIICLMVGSDLKQFADLADSVSMPQTRQQSCAADFSKASWSWETVLRPHLRGHGRTKQSVKVSYGPEGEHAVVAKALRAIGLIDLVANYAEGRYAWHRAPSFEAKTCGGPDVYWDTSALKIVACYEMAANFARLYRAYGLAADALPSTSNRQNR